MTPSKSYIIWFVPRSGSTLLCKGLESTGIAGIPGEYFTLSKDKTLLARHQVKNYESLKQKLWSLGTTPNGIFGVKYPLHASWHKKLFTELWQLRGRQEAPSENDAVWDGLLPNCRHVFLMRRNKVRLAVSWWKAIQDNAWHLERGKSHVNPTEFYEEKYDFNALVHLFKEAVLRECAMQEYFSRHGVSPLTIAYEDFVQNYEATIRSVVNFLGENQQELHIGPMHYERTADEGSEAWVQRFREELQENMGQPAW